MLHFSTSSYCLFPRVTFFTWLCWTPLCAFISFKSPPCIYRAAGQKWEGDTPWSVWPSINHHLSKTALKKSILLGLRQEVFFSRLLVLIALHCNLCVSLTSLYPFILLSVWLFRLTRSVQFALSFHYLALSQFLCSSFFHLNLVFSSPSCLPTIVYVFLHSASSLTFTLWC